MPRSRRILLALALLLSAPRVRAQGAAAIDYAALRDETVRAMREYLAINTTNPPGNELATAKWLQAFLAKEGIDAVILDTAELGAGRANLYARLKGSGRKKALALVHHMDVVPANAAAWKVPPFSGALVDGEIWGRGALDMKGTGIIHLMTMVAIKRAGVKLDRDLVFIANSDEESEGWGARIFCEKHKDLLADVEFLVTEGEGTRVEHGTVEWFGVGVAEKRPYWMTLTVQGVPSHGSIPTAANPVPKIAQAVVRAAAWQTEVRLIPSVDLFFKAQAPLFQGEERRWLANAAAALADPRGRAFLLSDPYRNAILRNTVVPTVLQGSDKTNIIPGRASAQLDIRLLPDQDTAAFHRELDRVIGDTAVHSVVFPGVTPPYEASINTAFFHAAERVIGRLLPGVPVATPLATGATDRPTYAQLGIQAYGIEPFLVEEKDELAEVHGNDERVSVKNVEFGLRLMVGIVLEVQ
ncbi:MAG TPA: M20/M25/M40 family metallo-hydrolase [Gemmatimonadaceae bacterium]|nr:M20/M25/M40 family metallo-hydrolase [Gemmatimonadaceae bacterium]